MIASSSFLSEFSANVHFVASVTFIRVEGPSVPYKVVFTPVSQPDTSFMCLLDVKDYEFDYEHLYHNLNVYNFPSVKCECHTLTDNFDDDVINLYDRSLKENSWDPTTGAVNEETHIYVGKLLPHVILLPKCDPALQIIQYMAREYKIKNLCMWEESTV